MRLPRPLQRRSIPVGRTLAAPPRPSVVAVAEPEGGGEASVALASDYFEAIENDPSLPTVTWVVGDRGTESDDFQPDTDDPLGLGSADEDLREVLDVMRASL